MSKKKKMTDLNSGLNNMKITNGDVSNDPTLIEFKTRIKDVMLPDHDDYQLVKWLKARNFDVGKAEVMYRDSMAYRKKMNLDKINDYVPPEVLQKYMPGGFAGFDKDGSPVRVELFGYLDVKGIIHSARKVDIEKTKLQLGENVKNMLEAQTQKLGKRVDGMTVILDLDNVGTSLLWGPGMQMLAHMGKVIQDNYPETVRRSFIINAPRIFPMLWKMIRPLITEEMKKKVNILGADYKKELLHSIDEDQLPVFLGGTMKDPDGNPRCSSRICQGGKVPEKYFLKELTTLDHMTSITVLQKDKYRLKYKVDIPGSILRWEFRTDGYDIAFGIKLETSKGKVDVMKSDRINSHMLPEDGMITCKEPGTYIVIFDNSYSMLRSKSVHYNIDILPPEDSTVVKDIDTMVSDGGWVDVAQKSESTHL